MKRLILKKGEEISVSRGSPWVWRDEIRRVFDESGAEISIEALTAGEIADVESAGKTYLGRAFVSPHSKITARIFSPSKEGVDAGFFKRRLNMALSRRKLFYDFSCDSFRAVFSEADFLPGLIADRFIGWPLEKAPENGLPLTFEKSFEERGAPVTVFSVQFLTAAMDSRRGFILDALCGVPQDAPCFAVYDKPDDGIRALEGLPLSGVNGGLIYGSRIKAFLIFENGFPFLLDFENSQKTGHYLDQALNRKITFELLKGLSGIAGSASGSAAGGGRPQDVLDVFCYTGGFSMQAARAGARVTAVDSSAGALSALKTNAALGGVEDRVETIEGDAFETLAGLNRGKAVFDAVILDPPAFAKTHPSKTAAMRGYREINKLALKLIRRGGLLVTASCSGAVDEWHFRQVIKEAALAAERRIYLLERRSQAPDHPVLLGHDECAYLKCEFYRVE